MEPAERLSTAAYALGGMHATCKACQGAPPARRERKIPQPMADMVPSADRPVH